MNLEKAVFTILRDNMRMTIGGWQNAVSDGDFEMDYYNKLVTDEHLLMEANELLLDAYDEGYLESEMDSLVVEAKHIKFLGKDKISEIVAKAVEYSVKESGARENETYW